MAFNPNEPQNGEVVDADLLRSQFNALNDRLNGASAALDWSNGAPKLPDYESIAAPVLGNIAYNYSSGHLMAFDGGDWQQL
jgi:hypothetical protein